MGAAEWAMLLGLSVIWGASFFFFALLVEALPPFTIVLGRLIIAGGALTLIALLSGGVLKASPRRWLELVGLGVVSNTLPFALIAFAETRISSGQASVLNAATPIFALLIAHVVTTDDRLSWNRAAGAVLAFLGVATMVGPSALTLAGRDALPGQGASILAALLYGVAVVWGRRFRDLPPLQLSAAQLSVAAVATVPFAVVADRPWTLTVPGWQVWAALFGLALISTALAYLIYFRVLKTAGANVSLVTVMSPAWAIALGVAFLGEALEPRSVAGFALIALGLALVDGRVLGALKRRAPSP